MYTHRISLTIAALLIASSFHASLCMQNKKAIEARWKDYLAQAGTQDADEPAQIMVQQVTDLYKKSGLLPQDHTVVTKFISDGAIQELEKMGAPSWNNMFNNGINILHLDKRYKEVDPQQAAFFVGHEEAHMVIRHHDNINPHIWMNRFVGISPLIAAGCLFHAYKSKTLPIKVASAFTALATTTISGLCEQQKKRHPGPNNTVQPHYPSIQKYEEILADIIAARVIPNGAHHGKEWYKTCLAKHGNTNGGSGSHPWTTSRIAYLEILEKIEPLINKQR